MKKQIFDVVIKFATKSDYHIETQHIEDLYILEDIYSFFISGKLVYNDKMATLEFGPLTGNEEIMIETEAGVQQYQIQKVQRAYPIWANAEGKFNTIEIFFVEKAFNNLISKEFSRSWKNTKYSDIIKHIGEKMVGVNGWDEFECSNECTDFYMPYWTPLQAINWLTGRFTGTCKNTPDFLFFQNLASTSGPSNLATLEKLMNACSLGKYEFHSKKTSPKTILFYNISGIDSLSKQDLKGGVRRGYDFSRKKFLEKKYEYKSDMVPKHTMLGKKSLFDDISDSSTSHVNLGIDSKDIITNYYTDQWIKRYDLQQTVSITVPGDPSIHCGKAIEIDWKSAEEGETNKNLNSYYLIKSVTHSFAPEANPPFRQKLNLIKNAYYKSERCELVCAVKKRI